MGSIKHFRSLLSEVGIVALLLGVALFLRIIAAFHTATEVDEPVYQFAASYFMIHGFPAVKPEYNQPLIPFLYHPPFALMVLGEWFRFWGNTDLLTGRFFSIVCSMIMLLIIYLFFRKVMNKNVAMIILLLIAMDPWIIFTNQAVYIENSQMILIVLAVWAYWSACESDVVDGKKHILLYVLAGALLGFAIIWKHIGGFLMIGVIANLVLQKKHFKGHILLSLIVVTIVSIYVYLMHLRFGALYDDATFTQIRRTLWDRYSPGLNYSPTQALTAIYTRYWIFPVTILTLVFGSLVTTVRCLQYLFGRRKGNTVILTWALGGIIFALGSSLKSPHYMILWLVPLYSLLTLEGLPAVKYLLRSWGNIVSMKSAVSIILSFLIIVNCWTFYMRFLDSHGDTLVEADGYINKNIPYNAVIATEDYIGMDIVQPYIDIAPVTSISQLENGPETYVAFYWSTTDPVPATLQLIHDYCVPLKTFSGFKDTVEVCKLDKFTSSKSHRTSIPVSTPPKEKKSR